MVGTAVRKGANGRGGLRFQILAVTLTHLSVALAYTPIAVQGIAKARTEKPAQTTSTAQPGLVAPQRSSTANVPTRGAFGCLLASIVVAGVFAALPVVVVVSRLPFGLMSAIIIGVGMHQAWRMTGAPTLMIFGPYRVGTTPTATTP
jgi:hypothetical protein